MANDYTISGTPVTTAAATDLSLCRVSGYLKDIMGRPLKGYTLKIRNCSNPAAIFPVTAVWRDVEDVVSNSEGYVEFDLYRGATVSVEIPWAASESYLECAVPDAASIELIDFLYPYLVSVAFDDTGPVAMVVGETRAFAFTGTLSNGETVELNAQHLVVESSDENVLAPIAGGLIFVGEGAGAVQLSVTSVDVSALGINQTPSGDDIVLFDQPSVALPAALDVNVTT